jgi:phosphoglycerol transferase MdoB-like AlkP superfamily enzyme
MENAYRKSATSYGITLGVILSLLTVIGYAVYLDLFTAWWFVILKILLIIVFGILSSNKTKQLVEGYTTFKQAFTGYFITIALGTFISTVVSLLIFNVIDTDAAQILNEKIIENSEAMMQKFGAPQSEIDKAIVAMEEDNQFSMMNYIKGWFGVLVFYAVVGLIVALIFREKDPTKV